MQHALADVWAKEVQTSDAARRWLPPSRRCSCSTLVGATSCSERVALAHAYAEAHAEACACARSNPCVRSRVRIDALAFCRTSCSIPFGPASSG
eukprot:6190513-Pleurochrysis_carterae.AAC.7